MKMLRSCLFSSKLNNPLVNAPWDSLSKADPVIYFLASRTFSDDYLGLCVANSFCANTAGLILIKTFINN